MVHSVFQLQGSQQEVLAHSKPCPLWKAHALGRTGGMRRDTGRASMSPAWVEEEKISQEPEGDRKIRYKPLTKEANRGSEIRYTESQWEPLRNEFPTMRATCLVRKHRSEEGKLGKWQKAKPSCCAHSPTWHQCDTLLPVTNT